MDPKIIPFTYINGLVVLLLIAYLVFWRSKRQPSRLKLRQKEKTNKLESWDKNSVSANFDFKNAPENQGRTERVLNVIFQFNGHDFDAYEVLGIPAGSSLDVVEREFPKLLKNSPEDSHDFLLMAFDAIKRKLTRL